MAQLICQLLQSFVGSKIEIVRLPEQAPIVGVVQKIYCPFVHTTVWVYLDEKSASPKESLLRNPYSKEPPYIELHLTDANGPTRQMTLATFNGKTLQQLLQATMAEAQPNVVDERKRCAALRDDLAATTSSDADACVVVTKDDQQLRANKLLLSARSVVFAAMFRTDMKEKKTNKIVMSSHSPEAVKVFLQLLGGMSDELRAEHLPDLVDLFEMYQVQNLVNVLGRHRLTALLTVENAADLFFKAAEYTAQQELLDLIATFVTKNQAAVTDSAAWKKHIEKGLSGFAAKALLAAQKGKL